MPKLIRPDGDAAVFITDGFRAAWAISGEVIAAWQGVGVWDTRPVQVVPRSALKALTLEGPPPSYAGVDPSLPGRTTRADFAPATPAALTGTLAVSGDVRVVG